MQPINLPQLITNSRIQAFQTCRRKHQFSYELAIKPAQQDSAALRFGTVFHEALDVRAKGGDAVATVDMLYQDAPPEQAVERATCRALVAAYCAYWGEESHEVIASEIAFEIPLTNPDTGAASTRYKLAGKIDKVVRLADGRLAVMEHKTTGESIDEGADYWLRLRLDSQISTYMLAAKRLGHEVETVLYDVIRKPGIAPKQVPTLDENGLQIYVLESGARALKKDGTPYQSAGDGRKLLSHTETAEEFGDRLAADIAGRPEFYFQRREIPRLDSDLEEAAQEIWDAQKAIAEAANTGRHYRNSSACFRMGRCQYFDLCFAGWKPGDSLPAAFVHAENAHSELV